MPRLRLATLRRQSRDSARRFSRRSCARATAIAARLRLSENSLRSFKPLRGLRARSPSAPSPPPACAGTGRRVGRSHRPPCPRRRAPRVLAWRRFSASCRFFAFFALAAQAGAPSGAFLLAGARRFAFSARAASRSQTKREFCIIEGSLTGSRPSATPSISEYSKNRAHIVRSGRAIFLRCLQNLRFVWLRLGFGFCAVRHRAIVVLCLFPSFAFLFSLVYAATAPTRDGGRSSASFLKKQARLRRPFFSKRVDISPHFCYTNYRRVLYGGFSCHTTFPIVRARACGLMFSWECSELSTSHYKGS